MVAKFSGLDQMSDSEKAAKDDTEAANDNIGDTEEGISTTNDSAG